MSFEEMEVGAWSARGEFLGIVSESEGEQLPADYLSIGRGDGERGMSVTLHRFSRGGESGYRVQVRRWGGDEEQTYWVAPTVEDEGYIGLFTEEEARREFPYLFAAQEMPGGFEIT